MPKLSTPEKSILFLNNLAGDDLWEYGHLMVPGYQQHSLPLELGRYKASVQSEYNSAGIHLTSVEHNLSEYGEIQIYGFPFLPISVDPFDIEYRVPVHGLVITEDMRMFDYFADEDPNFYNTADLRFSRLAWAKTKNLPTILAVHHADKYNGDLEKLKRLVGMDLFCPVVWHNGPHSRIFLEKTVEIIFSEITQF
jgi:hypothetical protein